VTITGNLTCSIAIGAPGGARAQERPGGGDRAAAPGAGRYHLVLTASVNNLANRPNFSGFSGIHTSPFYLAPTTVTNPRKFDVGVGIRF